MELANKNDRFLEDLQKVYDMVIENNNYFSGFYDINNPEKATFLDSILDELQIRKCDESRFALGTKLSLLKNDSMMQFLKKEGYSQKEIDSTLDRLYLIVSKLYINKFENLLDEIDRQDLLSSFYRAVLRGAHEVGFSMNSFFLKWKNHIIYNINRRLYDEFGSDDNVMEFMQKENLLDLGHYNEVADRSYSALVIENGKYIKKSYFDAFPKEIRSVIEALKNFKENLETLEDDVYNLKDEYIDYLNALIDAFSETDTDNLVSKWCTVDEKWMKITSPLQIGHPLEYYDDHYRKAVQVEWDIRIINPKFSKNNRVEKVKNMYKTLFESFSEYDKVYDLCNKNLDRTQLYLGRPALYYGSNLNGLFSAQVVPNDMVASEKFGKKIFAFADLVLENSRNRPLMKLPKMVYEKEFLDRSYDFLLNETEKWHQVYDIETIGHEYGHVLWLDEDTEVRMNKTANFKNIEEFKATAGGLVSFFIDEDDGLRYEFTSTLLKRAIGLIAWMEVGEVQPYYCEAMIHLKGLFDTSILKFDGNKVQVDINDQTYEDLKKWYINTYLDLARIYLEKRNADEFLMKYVDKDGKTFMPKDDNIKRFVTWYYELYKKHGNEIDDQDSIENYLR